MLVAEGDTHCSLEFCVCLTICSTLAVTTVLSQLTMEYISWGRGAMTHTGLYSSIAVQGQTFPFYKGFLIWLHEAGAIGGHTAI